MRCTAHEGADNKDDGSRFIIIIIVVFNFTADAVYAMAHGVHNIIEDVCETKHELCDSLKPAPPGHQLLQYIRNVTFVGQYEIVHAFISLGIKRKHNCGLNLFSIYIM